MKCRAGNVLTLIWAIRKGKDSGCYIIAYNHNTKELEFDDVVLYRLVKPRMILLLFSLIGGAILLGVITRDAGFAFLGAGLGAIGGLIVGTVLSRKRLQAFKTGHEMSRIVEMLESVQLNDYELREDH